jgi:hypothetical protein
VYYKWEYPIIFLSVFIISLILILSSILIISTGCTIPNICGDGICGIGESIDCKEDCGYTISTKAIFCEKTEDGILSITVPDDFCSGTESVTNSICNIDLCQFYSLVKASLDDPVVLNGNPSLDSAIANLNLPNHLSDYPFLTITWTTNNSAVITANGTVTRQPDSDSLVKLTTTLTQNGATATKDFLVTVKKIDAADISLDNITLKTIFTDNETFRAIPANNTNITVSFNNTHFSAVSADYADSGDSGTAGPDIFSTCTTEWYCELWTLSACSKNGIQTRTCKKLYNCTVKDPMSITSRTCTYVAQKIAVAQVNSSHAIIDTDKEIIRLIQMHLRCISDGSNND